MVCPDCNTESQYNCKIHYIITVSTVDCLTEVASTIGDLSISWFAIGLGRSPAPLMVPLLGLHLHHILLLSLPPSALPVAWLFSSANLTLNCVQYHHSIRCDTTIESTTKQLHVTSFPGGGDRFVLPRFTRVESLDCEGVLPGDVAWLKHVLMQTSESLRSLKLALARRQPCTFDPLAHTQSNKLAGSDSSQLASNSVFDYTTYSRRRLLALSWRW